MTIFNDSVAGGVEAGGIMALITSPSTAEAVWGPPAPGPDIRDLAGSEVRGLLRQAKTDSDPHITYDPQDRPEVANLLLLTALCEETDPRQLAEQIGSRGAAELKRRATEAVNERLRPVRDRRSELMRDRGYLRTVLRDGSAAARSIAQSTLARVAAAMHTNY